MDRAELTRAALSGRIVNGPLLILALWLDRGAADLRAEHVHRMTGDPIGA